MYEVKFKQKFYLEIPGGDMFNSCEMSPVITLQLG